MSISISGMNAYYSLYRYGLSSGNLSVRAAQKTNVQNADPSSKNAAVQAAPSRAASNTQTRPASFSGGRLYLSSPVSEAPADGKASAGSMQMGASPEELAVRMRIQYLDPASSQPAAVALNASGKPAAENPAEIPELSEQAGNVSEKKAPGKVDGSEECQTCKERKYQDGSNDMGVSFKTPTRVAPEAAASAVRSHEQEHVVREQAKAEQEDRRVVSQNVTLHTGICPECGEVYISGGTTRTVTAAKSEQPMEQSEVQNASAENRRPFFAVA